MNIKTADRIAAEHNVDFWYDRKVRLWVVQCDDYSDHVSPGALKAMDAEDFTSCYVRPVVELAAEAAA